MISDGSVSNLELIKFDNDGATYKCFDGNVYDYFTLTVNRDSFNRLGKPGYIKVGIWIDKERNDT